jgi:hypothetical protein
LPEWRALSGFDAHTVGSFVNWTALQNDAVLFMNPTDFDSTINLGLSSYLDLDSNTVCGTLTLAPYTSKVLIRTGDTCYQTVPPNLALQEISAGYGDTSCYNAAQVITVAGGGTFFTVEEGANVNLIAGQNIIMLPGTLVQQGGNLSARITLTSDYCPGYQLTPDVSVSLTEAMRVAGPDHFMIYPNPSNGIFTLKYTGNGTGGAKDIGIYSITGRKEWEEKLPDEKQRVLSLPWLKPGIYVLVIRTGQRVESLKMLVL